MNLYVLAALNVFARWQTTEWKKPIILPSTREADLNKVIKTITEKLNAIDASKVPEAKKREQVLAFLATAEKAGGLMAQAAKDILAKGKEARDTIVLTNMEQFVSEPKLKKLFDGKFTGSTNMGCQEGVAKIGLHTESAAELAKMQTALNTVGIQSERVIKDGKTYLSISAKAGDNELSLADNELMAKIDTAYKNATKTQKQQFRPN